MQEHESEPPIDETPPAGPDDFDVPGKKRTSDEVENEPRTGTITIDIIPRTEDRFMCLSFTSHNRDDVAAYNYAIQRVMRQKKYYPYHTGGIEEADQAQTGTHVWEINPGFHTPQITVPMVQNWLPLIRRYAQEYLDQLRQST